MSRYFALNVPKFSWALIAAGGWAKYDTAMNLGMPEMIFIFLLALLLFGPKKLPQIGRELGKALNEFRRASNEFKNQLETEIAQVEAAEQEKAVSAPAPAELIGRTRTAADPADQGEVEPRILPPSEPGFATTIGQAVESEQLEPMPPIADGAHDPDPTPSDTTGAMNFNKTPLRESNA